MKIPTNKKEAEAFIKEYSEEIKANPNLIPEVIISLVEGTDLENIKEHKNKREAEDILFKHQVDTWWGSNRPCIT